MILKNYRAISALLFALAAQYTALAQQDTTIVGTDDKTILKEITVTDSRATRLLQKATRTVFVFTKTTIDQTPARTLNEVLETNSALDVRQRGPLDIQADISVRGGTYEQTLILLNGIRMNDPQTGHHNMNLPISLDLIEKIEVLEGGASRVYGPNAFAGAVNMQVPTSGEDYNKATAQFGQYYLADVGIALAKNFKKWYALGSLNLTRSSGYIPNTDFEYTNMFGQAARQTNAGLLVLNAGFNAKDFGAQNFYSTTYPEQFEATKTLFFSAKISGGDVWKYTGQAYWRQHHDRFELFRETDGPYRNENGTFIKNESDTAKYSPGSFEVWNYYAGHNYHRTRVFGSEGKITRNWEKWGTTTIGFDYRNEQIVSNNLGKPISENIPVAGTDANYTKADARNNYSLYAEQVLNYKRFLITGGVLANYNSAFGFDAMPGLDLGYIVNTKNTVYASIDRSFRLPTYTDLYYNLAGAQGSQNLQPEYSLNYEVGYRYRANNFTANAAVFRRDGKNLIDWVQWKPDSLVAENITQLQTTGFTLNTQLALASKTKGWIKSAGAGYTFLTADQADTVQSLYVLDFLKHKFYIGITHKIFMDALTANWRLTYQNRTGNYYDYQTQQVSNYTPAWLLDGRIQYDLKKKIQFFVAASNILNVSYQDRGNVAQPGIWASGGFTITF